MKEERHIIGFEEYASGNEAFYSFNPVKNQQNEFVFYNATEAEIELAVKKAATAFPVYRKKSGNEKAIFLEAIAAELMQAAEELVPVCNLETALPELRIKGELGRTVNQLKMFASLLREGSWVDARIETAIPDRSPIPKPDIRFMHTGIGPIVVFGASNFPLAFSVAGGDTASALAAGCPVIVKAHPAHPATSAIAGRAIQAAARKTNMPDGVFSLLFDNTISTGLKLVLNPFIKAVAFTGSFKAGKAIFDAAMGRPEPIPVYAEMGSSNPVFVLPRAARENSESIAAGFAASVTLGVGQFCTNPGLLLYENAGDHFKNALKKEFEKTSGGTMLTPGIVTAYQSGVLKQTQREGVEKLASGSAGENGNYAQPSLLSVDAGIFMNNPEMEEEIFGPVSLAVNAGTKAEMLNMARALSGHLTATVFGTPEDLEEYHELFDILELKAGRLLINGFPTGVEVCSAMVHGGPFPATTDSRSTSVGTASVSRFTRPVCYQNFPEDLLPVELRNKNTLGIHRLINGDQTNKDIN